MRILRFMLDDVETRHKTGDFPRYIANDLLLIETPSARVVVVFFSAHHRGYYSELEDAIGRMSEQVWDILIIEGNRSDFRQGVK